MGLSLSAGTSPSVGKPSFELEADEMELGLGIHGEPGVKRMQLRNADELTKTLLTEILKHGKFGNEERVAVMVNNLGATTEMELAIVARHVTPVLESNGYRIERIYAGTFLSSLDMAGISISVLSVDDERLLWLDAKTSAPAWPNAPKQRPGKARSRVTTEVSSETGTSVGKIPQTQMGRRLRRAIESACNALIDAEDELTNMDRVTGDGDLGTTMKRAAEAVRAAVDSYPLYSVPATLKALGHLLRREMGGSSGPLYGVLFLRCGNVLASSHGTGLTEWVEALDQACLAISELGGAKPGDRTMLDALVPFVKSLKGAGNNGSREILLSAVEAAKHGVEATAEMTPRVGRSSYLGDRVLGHPDPGAQAIVIWLHAVTEALFP